MQAIYIKPLPQDFLTRVRERGLDDQLQPVRRYISTEGGEPCRDVLRRARPGEEVILASFCPYTQAGPYKEFGPVYQQFQIQNFHRLKVLKWDADSQDNRIIQDAHILKILLSGQSASRFKLQ